VRGGVLKPSVSLLRPMSRRGGLRRTWWRSVVPTAVSRGDPDARSRSTSHDQLMAAAMTSEPAP
jgi:hypothetical protein